MTKGIRFAQGLKVLPVLGPVDTAATAAVTKFVDMNMANWCTFLVQLGNLTSDDSDKIVITARASTEGSSAATEPTCINFWYRLTSAVDTDSMSAGPTAGTSDGIGTSDDGVNAVTAENAVLIIDIDPSVVAAKGADMRWVSLGIAPEGPITLLGVTAIVEHKYPGNNIPSST
jgi:hypothetical protein